MAKTRRCAENSVSRRYRRQTARMSARAAAARGAAAHAGLSPVFLDGFEDPFRFFDVAPKMIGHVFGGEIGKRPITTCHGIDAQHVFRTSPIPVEDAFGHEVIFRENSFGHLADSGLVVCERLPKPTALGNDHKCN